MSKRLRVWLPDDWRDISAENPNGPPTFCWWTEDAKGAFQVSTAEYSGGEKPSPDEEYLVRFAVEFGRDRDWGRLKAAYSGKCHFGIYGSASFEPDGSSTSDDDPMRYQIWCISNGLDFIFATFLASCDVSEEELDAAQLIAEGIDFS